MLIEFPKERYFTHNKNNKFDRQPVFDILLEIKIHTI